MATYPDFSALAGRESPPPSIFLFDSLKCVVINRLIKSGHGNYGTFGRQKHRRKTMIAYSFPTHTWLTVVDISAMFSFSGIS